MGAPQREMISREIERCEEVWVIFWVILDLNFGIPPRAVIVLVRS